ncbi:hypothetical protein Z517_09175 [Fonsecaea pedrosoi CBS 271.37]|uniref:MARVEL domain-containing protein n=1 Tax=Fonsecaea pedrosoi CBS 271.37 TaxID=1442368 RepID=A0A0D2DGC1_9EURO|nr:uncharacterized protein Z517_09175 [Fonsecaea pedrosoi CBS 271.37]KIW76731.1 hypothetical protein Z517_09175 [Fonsecaea pedrosoi CBS 271.37]
MWDIQMTLGPVRIAVAAAIGVYFLGAKCRHVQTRRRDEAPFVWLLMITFFVAAAELTALIALWADGISKFQPLAVATLYVLALLVHLNHLLPTPIQANDDKTGPSWHAYVGAWTFMILSDMLAIVELAVVPISSQSDLIFAAALSLRGCLLLASIATTTIAKASSAQKRNGLQSKKRKCSPTLRRNISEEIRDAGGRW